MFDLPKKETVILVHGTWAETSSDVPQWFKIPNTTDYDQSFVGKLDMALTANGSLARCWAHCAHPKEIFCWSGANSKNEREIAARELAKYVQALIQTGWTCHVVAHSHGGNILINTMNAMKLTDKQNTACNLVTLGTPFIDESKARRDLAANELIVRPYIIAFFLLACFSMLAAMRAEWMLLLPMLLRGQLPQERWGELAPYAAIAVGLLVWLVKLLISATARGDKKNGLIVNCLSLNHPMDEALQALSHLRGLPDPLAVRDGLLKFLWTSTLLRACQEESGRIASGGKSYSDISFAPKLAFATSVALLLPLFYWNAPKFESMSFLFVLHIIIFIGIFGEEYMTLIFSPVAVIAIIPIAVVNLPKYVALYYVRARMWRVILGKVMGIDSLDGNLPRVDREPYFLEGRNVVKYENIPDATARGAKEKRSIWIASASENISAALAAQAIDWVDLEQLLRTIETDATLIHASYYQDDACVWRIAEWIANVR